MRRRPRPARAGDAVRIGTIEQTDPTPRPPTDPPPTTSPAATRRRPRLSDVIIKLAWSADDVARLLGLSRRWIERELSAGRFPAPDLRCGRRILWRPETVRAWVAKGGQS
jgi:excisionase family DNA binding protein